MPDDNITEVGSAQPSREVTIHTPRGPVVAQPGEDFMTAIIRAARHAGVQHIRIFAGDMEISDTSQAPSRVIEGQVIRIEPYDPVGC